MVVTREVHAILHHNAVVSNRQSVHGLVDRFLNLLPIATALDELIYADVSHNLHTRKKGRRRSSHNSLLRPEATSIPRHISHNLREIFGVGDDIYVSEHLEVREILCYSLLLQRGDESVVGIEVCYDLETAFERYDLAFQVALEDSKISIDRERG